jgi:hypothetical protein
VDLVVLSRVVEHHFGGVVKVDASGAVGEKVAQPVLGRVVYPFFDVNPVTAVKGITGVAFGSVGLEVVVAQHLRVALELVSLFFLVLLVVEEIPVKASRSPH